MQGIKKLPFKTGNVIDETDIRTFQFQSVLCETYYN